MEHELSTTNTTDSHGGWSPSSHSSPPDSSPSGAGANDAPGLAEVPLGDPAPPGSLPIRVLHVDDERTQRVLTATWLERIASDLTIRSVADPADVLAWIEAEPVDCVVSDLQMLGRDGLELCEVVRDAYPEIPFVLFTSHDEASVVDRAADAGATAYVRKSPGVDQFRRLAIAVADAVARPQPPASPVRPADPTVEFEPAAASGPVGMDETTTGD